jgi:hypothetical protein
MKMARLPNAPAALIDFFQESLEALGAICERTWHDRLHLVAEGPAARLWNADGDLIEKTVHFVPPEDPSPRHADQEVFPGCPLTFRLAEELRPRPLTIERGVFQPSEKAKPPPPEVGEKLWQAQMPGASRWHLLGDLVAARHFSLLALARCEIQAIDQHWTTHRIAVSLPDGQRDQTLPAALDFLQLDAACGDPILWPAVECTQWQEWLNQAFAQELESDLVEIRDRQQRYLRRELERIDSYFAGYEKELAERQDRTHSEGIKVKTETRLAAAKIEHQNRRQDQIRRHAIRVIPHLDALLLLAEPSWQARISLVQRGIRSEVSALFVPRSRRWIVTT